MTSNRIIAFSLILTQLKGDNCHLTFRNLWLFCPINHNWKKPIFILRSQSFIDDVHWDTTRIFFLFPLFSLISNEVEFLASCYQCWQDGSQFSLPFTRLCQRLVKISQQFEEVCNLKRNVILSRQEKSLYIAILNNLQTNKNIHESSSALFCPTIFRPDNKAINLYVCSKFDTL